MLPSLGGTLKKINKIKDKMPEVSNESTTIKIKETAHINPFEGPDFQLSVAITK